MVQFHRLYALQKVFIVENCIRKKSNKSVTADSRVIFPGFQILQNQQYIDQQVSNNRSFVGGEVREDVTCSFINQGKSVPLHARGAQRVPGS